ncbi:hypothetical protein JOC76_003007 [Neobacillus cucumis]|nr:hypothetical protein [Neobacillus cucumis]
MYNNTLYKINGGKSIMEKGITVAITPYKSQGNL